MTSATGVISGFREQKLLQRSFVLMLKAEGKSPTTVKRYELSVGQCQEFARAMGCPQMLTREHVAHFLAQRLETKAGNTVRNDYMALVRFFRFLLEEGEITSNPIEHIRAPKGDDHIPDPYSPEDVRKMLAAAKGRTFVELRDAAIVWILLDTGLRASEFCRIGVSDVELDVERIKVVGKGRRERFVRIGLRAQRAVDRYLRVRTSARPELWVNRVGGPLTISGLFQIVERLCIKAGVQHPGIHRFRHTAATMMRDLGIGDRDLMTLFGWSSFSMAARYTRSGERDRALRAHGLYSPADHLAN
ncbi:MAG: Tyrosine recombinase XerC [Nitrospira sp.]|nr:Tyrosine recombinase XerC [Nitrospira sp.]